MVRWGDFATWTSELLGVARNLGNGRGICSGRSAIGKQGDNALTPLGAESAQIEGGPNDSDVHKNNELFCCFEFIASL